MKKTGLITLSLLLVFSVGVSSAVEVTRFCGEFIREAGSPVIETVYEIPGVPGPGFLRVYNGAKDDSFEKVSNSIIIFNGVEVLSQENFNQNVDYLENNILLEQQNTISVELKGKPGGKIRVEIIQEGIYIPDTGQITCYDDQGNVIACPSPGENFYGQDANYNTNPRSYTKLDSNGNELDDSATDWAMVRDNVTGLVWEVKKNKDGVNNLSDPHDADNKYTWCDSNPATNGGIQGACGDGTDSEDFIAVLNAQNYGGHNDWRLPTVMELSMLPHADQRYLGPAINTEYFPNTVSGSYLSSTTDPGNFLNDVWNVSFFIGAVHFSSYSSPSYVRAVRGAQTTNILIDNGDGTVTDTTTGLMWQQDEAGAMDWYDSLSYCENLILADHEDWRLPNRNELHSLVDYSKNHMKIDTVAFPNAIGSYYYSSTTLATNLKAVWLVYFPVGDYSGIGDKSDSRYVRCVRGGH